MKPRAGRLFVFITIVMLSTFSVSATAYYNLSAMWRGLSARTWTWLSGYNTIGAMEVYGTQGVAAPLNDPGPRARTSFWIDASNNLWVFGGFSVASDDTFTFSQEIWKFNGSQWAWIRGAPGFNLNGTYGTKGVTSTSSDPGGRQTGASWVDGTGNFWLFGGWGMPASGSTQGRLNDLWKFDGTNWTWMGGSNALNQAGTYGTKGVAASTNWPGAREQDYFFKDSSGNFWLFGGLGYDSTGASGSLNDLWKFDGTNWTWIAGSSTQGQLGVYGTKGVASTLNHPGLRQNGTGWVDSSGKEWVFGGFTLDSVSAAGQTNELWRWDGTSWTWMKGSKTVNASGTYGTKGVAGSSNTPGARESVQACKDSSGNIYLFGGHGNDSAGTLGDLNDLWKWDGTNWTWISGSNLANQSGTYGTKGTASSSNVPGGRYGASCWIDSSNNFWLHGGQGYDSKGDTEFYLDDLWKWDGTNWSWMAGSNLTVPEGIYGVQGTAAATNIPGGRVYTHGALDSSENLWIFGGTAVDANGAFGQVNDLWKFDGTNWTWMKGSNGNGAVGTYGTKGVAASANTPGCRERGVFLKDSSGKFWFFGGGGYASVSTFGFNNDLWKFDGTNWTWISGSNTVGQIGSYGTLGAASASNVPGARELTFGYIDSSNNIWIFGGYGYDSVGGSNQYLNDFWKFDGTNWTWMAGSNSHNISGTYGTMGVTSPTNYPGSRSDGASAFDGTNFWIFGGYGYDSAGTLGELSDLWKFDGSNWTWMGGSNLANQSGSYGTVGVLSQSNAPGGRSAPAMFVDVNRRIWIIGGWGHDTAGTLSHLNDIWVFDGARWAWMGGSTTVNAAGVYGTQGLSAASNLPGARSGSAYVRLKTGEFEIFGGIGYDSNGVYGPMRDIWKAR